MMDKLGGRKMVAGTLTVGVGIGAALLRGDIPPNLLQLLEVVFGVFAGANAINTVAGLRISKVETAAEETPPAPVEEGQGPTPEPVAQIEAAAQSENVPNKDVIIAFHELANRQAASHAELKGSIDAIVKTLQMTQTALNTVAEKAFQR